MAESLETQREHWRRLLEALLFVAWEPAPVKRLAEALGLEPKFTQELLLELQEAYVGRGFQLVTQPEAAPYIERLYKPRAQQLSKAALETLAIVAYRQPVTRAEIDNIRQVKSDAMLAKLMEKTLVKEVGRLDAPGRPILYGTTQEFLAAFGLVSLQELPPLADIDENEEISLFSALQQQLEQE